MSGIDRFRKRESSNISISEPTFESEEIIESISRKRGAEELRIIVGQTREQSFVLIRTVRLEVSSWIPVRSIWFKPEHLEGVLDGIDQAAIRYGSMACIPEEDLPVMPLLCSGPREVQVKLDRFNGFFNIKISKATGSEFAVFSPSDIEPMITALVAAYDHTQGNATPTSHNPDFDF